MAAESQANTGLDGQPGLPCFVHLRLHSAYSLSEGAIRVSQLPELCHSHGMPALAITDTNNLFGALEFAETLTTAGIQPIIGCSLALSLGQEADGARAGQGGGAAKRNLAFPSIALLAQSREGYHNLMKLTSLAYRNGRDKAAVHLLLDDVKTHRAGLIALTGGREGPIDDYLSHHMAHAAKALLLNLAQIFPGKLYVELQRHGDEISQRTVPMLVDLAYELDLPLVATNEPYFIAPDLAEAHDALLCISQGAVIDQQDRRRLTPEHYFKSSAEMTQLFNDLPEALENTLEIAQRCGYVPRRHDPILPKFKPETGLSETEELRRRVAQGLKDRLASVELFDEEEKYWERLDYELDVIIRMDFPGYFLIVADFIQWAKNNDIPVGPGRGSGAGSVVSWALTITDLDPLRFNLLFERFLNPDRVSIPDFDIDFCQERRDEVIQYVQQKYGEDRVAQIITFGKLQARAVIRDIGRVLQMPYGQVDRISKLIPYNPANAVTLQQAIDGEPELQQMVRREESVAKLMELALKLEGLYRHASTHAAGVVIADRPLEELIPLYYDPHSDMPVTQFNLTWVEPAGLVKFDFLGLKTLTALKKVLAHLAQRGIEVNLETLPLDDAKTYEMLARGDAIGVFQFESAGMRELLGQAHPGNFEDLIALVALFRPGPMENIPKYLACKHGEEDPEFLHESLSLILADTYGVIIYQEQVMQIAQVLSGYSLGEADLLRRAMGKKKKDEMAQQKDRFIEGAVSNGVEKKQAGYIFDPVDKFAGYGFNKSHSAAYALIAYQTAYLKANYPVEFFAAFMSLDKSNTDKLNVFRRDAAQRGIKLLPPDINTSNSDFTTKDGCIVYALSAVKNVGEQAMSHVVEVREEGGRFKDIFDFARRIDPRQVNKRAFENLIRAGAFDRIHAKRAQLFASADMLLSQAAHATEERQSSQASLFGENTEQLANPKLREAEDWALVERLNQEMEAIGFYLSGHPLDDFVGALKRRKVSLFSDFQDEEMGEAKIVRLAGIVHNRQNRRSRYDDLPMAFVTLSDPSGSYEMTVLADLLKTDAELFNEGQSIVVTAVAKRTGNDTKLTAKAVQSVEQAIAKSMRGYRVFVDTSDALEGVRETLTNLAPQRNGKRTPTGVINLVLMLGADAQEVELELAGPYPIEAGIRGALKAVPGVIDVQDL
ncbi:MAG: DNA polymerase III subunit alpha [Alphaproteobacteria bacterium]|nr:MAG: DNA polymerase III subunit alpha [Alphaproteobacteria bacterium]